MPVSLAVRISRLPAMPLGVADVHAEQLGREERRLLAAGAGADLDDDVAVVVGVARQQLDAAARPAGAPPPASSSPMICCASSCSLRVRARSHARAARRRAASRTFAQRAVVLDDRRQHGPARGRALARSRRSAATPGLRPLGLDLVEPPLDLVEASSRLTSGRCRARQRLRGRRRHRRARLDVGGQVLRVGDRLGRAASRLPSGAGSPFAASASRIDAMATSIIESSGCLVVIAWSQMPGRNSQRTAQFWRCRGAPAEDLVGDGGDHRDEQDAARRCAIHSSVPASRLNSRMLTMMKTTRNSVPQRGWAVG